ncbi:hypothetical protein [Rhodobacter capsulatus]|uniref:Uncharacterized protein n=1 Tax=Rhodobacter capsulatus (strain ATCC BAA-309 / NBRC 16581 / SB1003) TaxID=272942 RepID=D5AL23_RHOCB|nr:hypothetical protein [Rhodobacter capsulatus]ADE86013.1 conserved hypothetical protein [Rhodobacter capsulatus SB 1003]ETD01312.1 hypothetical protein U714_12745 [Rhodobacter capsulatus DE442]ETD75890.1 hypothetical protein U717_12905 [Rhodobacter capsulatus R121]ETE53367.1 hypothetical protein U715_12905 [Rhodobacter capsulatus Y262]MDS0926871.1 hypothetical protein [Rhodobacter capsulatus]
MTFSSKRRLTAELVARETALRSQLGALAGALGGGPAAPRAPKALPLALGAGALGAGVLALAGYALLRRKPEAPAATPPHPETLARWEDEGGAVFETLDWDDDRWLAAAEAARDAARDELLSLYETGKASAEAKADIAAERARKLSEAFRHGLEGLGDEAADLIVTARQSVWEAMEAGGRAARQGLAEGKDIAARHPVAASAAGIAAGAGLMALSSHSRPALKYVLPLALAGLAVQAGRVFGRDRPTLRGKAEAVAEAAGETLETVSTAVARKTDAARATARRAEAGAKPGPRPKSARNGAARH